MEKTYLITGATSDVGYELIRTLNDGCSKFLLQGFGDGDALKALCKENGIDDEYFEVNLSDCEETDKFVEAISSYSPTHFVHLPALRVINTKFKNFDEERFLLDMNVQVMSAVKICKAVIQAGVRE